MIDKYLTRDVRKWLYGVSLAAVPLLVAYGVLDEAAAPLWIALVASVLAPTLALTHLTPEGDES
jgi:hypothetical protein